MGEKKGFNYKSKRSGGLMVRRGRREGGFSMALDGGRTGTEGAGTGSTGAVEAGTRGLR